jgi:hypothetical protein
MWVKRLLEERHERKVNQKLDKEFKERELKLALDRLEQDRITVAKISGRVYVPKGAKIVEHLMWSEERER